MYVKSIWKLRHKVLIEDEMLITGKDAHLLMIQESKANKLYVTLWMKWCEAWVKLFSNINYFCKSSKSIENNKEFFNQVNKHVFKSNQRF